MRFLRGFGVGIFGFGFWLVASIFAALSFIGKQEYGQSYDSSLLNPIWMLMVFVGFIIMVGGPLYYWIIEPIRYQNKPRQQYYAGAQPVPQAPVGQIANFCIKCGTQNTAQAKFCPNCGTSLVVH